MRTQPVLQSMLENATRICDASSGFLYLCEEEVYRIVAHARRGTRESEASQTQSDPPPPEDRPLVEPSSAKQRRAHSRYLLADPDYRGDRGLPRRRREEMHRTILAVPMLKEDD